MHRISIITSDSSRWSAMRSVLHGEGFSVDMIAVSEFETSGLLDNRTDLVFIDATELRLTRFKDVVSGVRDSLGKGGAALIGVIPADALKDGEYAVGLDDFLPAAASQEEWLARIRFLLWKTNRVDSSSSVQSGDLVIDLEKYEVRLGSRPVVLTFKEYELLRFLAQHPGKVFSRQALLDRVWGYEYYGGTRTVDVHIRRLRLKLEHGGATYIDTVRNVGYKFIG